jgi:hypothetical protein
MKNTRGRGRGHRRYVLFAGGRPRPHVTGHTLQQEMPSFLVGFIFVAGAVRGEGDVSVEASGDVGGKDVPKVEWDDVEEVDGWPSCARLDSPFDCVLGKLSTW